MVFDKYHVIANVNAAVDQARSPALIAAIQQAGSGRQRSDRAFELALDILIAGIANLADQPS